GKCDGGNTQCHRVDYRSPQSFRSRRMPEHVQTRYRVVNFVDKAGIESFHPRYRRAALALSAQEDKPGSSKQFTREATRDAAHHIQTFFLGHRADDAADHRAGGPATLL